jgi:hypothetical protein
MTRRSRKDAAQDEPHLATIAKHLVLRGKREHRLGQHLYHVSAMALGSKSAVDMVVKFVEEMASNGGCGP